jgi:hypothetical protein
MTKVQKSASCPSPTGKHMPPMVAGRTPFNLRAWQSFSILIKHPQILQISELLNWPFVPAMLID